MLEALGAVPKKRRDAGRALDAREMQAVLARGQGDLAKYGGAGRKP